MELYPLLPCVYETLTCIHMVPIQSYADRYAQGSIVLHLLFFCSFYPVSIHILQITNLINPHFSLSFTFCPKDQIYAHILMASSFLDITATLLLLFFSKISPTPDPRAVSRDILMSYFSSTIFCNCPKIYSMVSSP